jgi:site-specific DNA-methyltransferase (adenine-specific)
VPVDMRLGDCMDLMRGLPDKAFDLAIVDPPYRDENAPTGRMRNIGSMERFGQKPTAEYFVELFRVSQNQIIWGANNFLEHLRSVNCFLFWYKQNPVENYSDGELAWTSFDDVARCIPLIHFGAHTGETGKKIHPTQKTVALYKWLLTRYAKPGWKILDTHGGSGSHCLAAHDLGFDLTWIEKDRDYYEAACARYKTHAAQLHLIEPAAVEAKPLELFEPR